MPILVLSCYQLVLDGMSWEVYPPLRIRYAPRPEILDCSRVSFFMPSRTCTALSCALFPIPSDSRHALLGADIFACRLLFPGHPPPGPAFRAPNWRTARREAAPQACSAFVKNDRYHPHFDRCLCNGFVLYCPRIYPPHDAANPIASGMPEHTGGKATWKTSNGSWA